MGEIGCREGVHRASLRTWSWRPVLLVVVITGAVAGCAPHEQSAVVRDPGSGEPLLVMGLCAGERVDSVRVRQGSDGSGPVLWEVRRIGDVGLDRLVLGSVPPGFETVVVAQGERSRVGWAEVSLRGGGASRSGSLYDVDSLGELSQTTLDGLAGNAAANCSQVPFRSSWWLTAGVSALAGGVFVLVVRWAARAPRRPSPRPAVRSPWMYLSAAFGLMSVAVLWPGAYGQRSAIATYVLYGVALSAAALGMGLIGRAARRFRFADWLIVLPTLVLLLVASVVVTTIGGLFSDCGPGWTFDCTTSLLDRLVVLGCLIPAWFVAVWVAEGGWWPRNAIDPSFDVVHSPDTERATHPAGPARDDRR